MKGWRPQIDLVRLCTALSKEILAASDEDLRALAAGQSHAFAVAAREARTVIAAASGQDEPDPELVAANAALGAARLARQH